VSDARNQAILQALVRRESRSLLQYVRDTVPWTALDEQGADAARARQVRQLIEEENQAIGELMRFLFRRHWTPPYLGSYPADFTTLNYVSLDYLLPRLVHEERRALARLEADLVGLTDAECRNQVQRIMEMKRRHLQVLEGTANQEAAVRS
jgi:hypothetical protein